MQSLDPDLVAAEQEPASFHVVGVGASAGGLEALEHFFSALPSDLPAAFVVIQHLSPTHKSLMGELLAKHTDLPIQYAEDGGQIEPHRVYLIPPSKNLTLRNGQLHLFEQERQEHINFPIDVFFESLARERAGRAVGVVLSGTGSDGTKGIRAIKEQGGLVLVQKPESAKFDGMPRSALATNLVDLVMLPHEMPEIISSYTTAPMDAIDTVLDQLAEHENSYKRILDALRRHAGIDFSQYKDSTISRRIQHRMGLLQITDIDVYANRIRESEEEARRLQREMLIGVTRFFRDKESFESLDRLVLPELIDRAIERSAPTLRIWCAACSTGEEVYSLGMLLLERLRHIGRHIDVKMFATDVDRAALNAASAGIYPSSILADVPQDYLHRYFVKQGDYYQISRELRQLVVFAPHNLLKDPPFSKIDLISCRNLLIYLKPDTQQHAILQFIYAAVGGYLFLGNSENISGQAEYFSSLDSKARIFKVRGQLTHPPLARRRVKSDQSLTDRPGPVTPFRSRHVESATSWNRTELYEEALAPYMPPVMIIDDQRFITYCFGPIEPYMHVPRGRVEMEVSRAVHSDLRVPLGTALHKAFIDREEVVYRSMTIDEKDAPRVFDLIVNPLRSHDGRDLAVVVFDEHRTMNPVESSVVTNQAVEAETQQRILDLERKLRYTEESLQAAIEELETSNEELQATNEELMASNEELQSTNEELQSTNEELFSVNSELHAKVSELTQVNADMDSLLDNLEVSTIFLDPDLRIRKFTRSAVDFVSLSAGDIGRPIYHLSHVFRDLDLRDIAMQVLDTLESVEQQIQTKEGERYLMRLHPYHTIQDKLKGVVVMFIDMTPLHEAEIELMDRAAQIQSVANSTATPLAALDDSLTFTLFNNAYEQAASLIASVPPEPGRSFVEVFDAVIEANPEIEGHLGQCLEGQTYQFDVELNVDDEVQAFAFHLRPIRNSRDEIVGITHVMHNKARGDEEMGTLQEQAQVLGTLYDDTHVAIFMVDVEPNGTFRFADNNPTHARITGMQTEWLRGRTPTDLAPRLTADAIMAVKANYQRCLDTGASIQYEETIPIDGRQTRWLTRLTPIFDEEGRPRRIIGTAVDLRASELA